eukprot:1818626-Rhodomonas_salina.2
MSLDRRLGDLAQIAQPTDNQAGRQVSEVLLGSLEQIQLTADHMSLAPTSCKPTLCHNPNVKRGGQEAIHYAKRSCFVGATLRAQAQSRSTLQSCSSDLPPLLPVPPPSLPPALHHGEL